MFSIEINRAATEAFRSIIKAKGREILKNSKSVQNLMSDFLPGYEYEQVRNVIRIACEWNTFAILLDESIPEANRIEYAARQMTEKTLIPLETTRVVVSWAAEALNLKGVAMGQTTAATDNSVATVVTQKQISYSQGLAFKELDDGSYAVSSIGTCKDTELVIPPTTPYGKKVTTIRGHAFYNCSSLTSVMIPNSVTTIGDSAFSGCSGLISIMIPNSVTSIGEWAFCVCSGLTSVTIPNSVTTIGDWAFYKCSSLTSVSIPNSVTTIGNRAFYECRSLTSVTIPNSVTSIGKFALSYCSGLTSIKVEPNNPKYYSQDNCVIERETKRLVVGIQTSRIPNSVTSIGDGAFSGCSGLTSVTIPNSVTSIEKSYTGESPFVECSGLTSINVEPNNPKYYSQDNCVIERETKRLVVGIQTSRIPNSVKSIGEGAFWLCSGLTSVTIPNSVTSIGRNAFNRCSGLTSVTIPNSVESIGAGAFFGCSGLTSVTIPNSVTSIGDGAFSGCSGLTSVIIPKSVSEMSVKVFNICSKATIYCEHPSKPSDWDDDWNPDNRPVVWNYKQK